MRDPADDPTIVYPLDAAHIPWQIWLNSSPLLVAQPKQILAHDPDPLPKTNQDRILRAQKLMSFDPSHIPDVLADPEYTAVGYQKAFGFRTNLSVPLLRDGTTIGVLALHRHKVNPFTDKQIELATTFADQAVIAIENARLFEAEQQRTRELSESLEQQTATS